MNTPNDPHSTQFLNEHTNDTLRAALQVQMRKTSWYMGSIGVHVLLFTFLLLLPQPTRREKKPKRIITHSIEEVVDIELAPIEPDPEEETDLELDPLDTPDQPTITQKTPDFSEPLDITDPIEEDTPAEDALEDEAMGNIDEAVDSDPILGIASTGSLPTGTFAKRGAGLDRDMALLRNGGDHLTAKAVDEGLKWLASHQHQSGCWRAQDLGVHGALNVGITSVALLAFLGNGNSTECGRYRANVKRAINWLLRQKTEDGLLGRHSEMGVTLMALSEAYAMSRDQRIKTAATRIARYCAKTQFNCGGWDYSTTPYQTHLLVSGWYVLGLKSARMANIALPEKTWNDARTYFYRATSQHGRTFNFIPIRKDMSPDEISPRHDQRNVSMNLACLHFLGIEKKDPKVVAAADMALHYIPDTENPRNIDYNYLYYQGLGLFQMGTRTDYWQNYNKPMKKMLLDLQIKDGSYRELRGSWPPTHNDATNWGRVGATAMACLTLQIYYLY